jgi:dihydroxyacetone kinase-like protein
MKKLINDPGHVVLDSLAGLAAAHADILEVHFDPVFVVRKDVPVKGKVAIISGGGSGHEPLHAGFVGRGMLDAACPGEVFTSPTPDQIEAATRAVDGGAGVLHIVKNYTGDIMNFEMAADLCKLAGIEVGAVVIDDDVAVDNSLYTAGRRGVGATVLVEKIGGAAAERGYDLAQVQSICERATKYTSSMGVALTSCTVPAAGKPTFELGEQEMEMGIGIHGEPGRERVPLASAREIAERMTQAILSEPISTGNRMIAMVNGMGGTPLIELYLVYAELERLLRRMGITIMRRLVGNYITSLDMAGCSITLLRADSELLELWDDPVLTAGLRWGC